MSRALANMPQQKNISMSLVYRICFIVLTFLYYLHCFRAEGASTSKLLPMPQRYAITDRRKFTMKQMRVEAEALKDEAEALLLRHGYSIGSHYRTPLSIRIVDSLPVPRGKDEAYKLQISSLGIHIEAMEELGAYRALQTLEQILESSTRYNLEMCEILDWPEWGIRGFMHDVGRTYIPLHELKRQIALLSRFKVNVFHWHLTENQAWRIESKLYPQLNSIAATERMPGLYYSLAEAKELADWCRLHRVLLIPEIDMPGHSAAFERALGYSMQSDKGVETLKDLIRELLDAIDVPYIHIGTDEAEFTNPRFVPDMVAYIRSLGRKVISWNPGWDYKPTEIDMTQLWSYRGKSLEGVPAIDSRLHYINHFDLFADPISLYLSSILNRPHGDREYSGAILAVWNDRYILSPQQIVRENNLYLNMLALAERAWRGGGYGYFNKESTRLTSRASSQWSEFTSFERRFLWHKNHSLSKESICYISQSQASWLITPAFSNNGVLEATFPPETQYHNLMRRNQYAPPRLRPVYQTPNGLLATQTHIGSGAYLRHTWGENIVPGVFDAPLPNQTAYAMAWVYSNQNQRVGLLFETQNYSRSESDIPPPQGAWDYKMSRVWINGKEIAPPRWSNEHTNRSNEQPLGNENAASREPIPLKLHTGWNAILVKLPVGEFKSNEVRLVKWHFTLALTTPDGKEAAQVRYHHYE